MRKISDRIQADRWRGLISAIVIAITFARLFLVLVTISNPQGSMTLDSEDYISLSKALELEGKYSTSTESVDFVRPPGYPVFILLLDDLVEFNQGKIVFVQLLLMPGLALILMFLSRKRWYECIVISASVLIVLSPNITLWSMTIMSETLFTSLILMAAICIFAAIKSGTSFSLWISGLIMGVAILTRPIGLILAFIWIVLILVWFKNVESYKSSFMKIAILVMGICMIVLPWMARNRIVHGSFSVSPVGVNTLESFNFAIVISDATGISRNDATRVLARQGGTWDQFVWIWQNYPVEFIKGQIFGILRVFGGSELSRWATVLGLEDWSGFGIFRQIRRLDLSAGYKAFLDILSDFPNLVLLLIMILGILHTITIIGFDFIGFARKKRFDNFSEWVICFCTATVLTLVIITGAAGQARFRVPAEPFMAIIASFGILSLNWNCLGGSVENHVRENDVQDWHFEKS